VGAIYLYFRSKEDLYVSLLEETLQLFDAELSKLRAQYEGNSAEALKHAWSFLQGWATSDVEATRVLRLVSQPNIRKQLSDEVADAISSGIAKVRDHLGAMSDKNGQSQEVVDLFWALFLGVLQANDARINLDLPGGNLADLSAGGISALLAMQSGATGSLPQPTV
jgi:AcrR family transcriptional regulator